MHGVHVALPLVGGPSQSQKEGFEIPTPYRVLQPDEVPLLAAIAAMLTPEPGLSVSAIVSRLDDQLAGVCHRLLPAMRQGLEAIRMECKRTTGTDFQDMAEREQIRFVLSLRSRHKLTAFYSLIADQCRRAC